MKANHLSFVRTAGLMAGALALAGSAWAAEADALPTLSGESNYIKVSAGGSDIDGSKAAFQARTQNAKNGAMGIEAFNYSYELGNKTSLSVDGRVLPGAEDYLASFKLTKEEFGSLEVGYKRFRTFYDGAGGFFPLNNAWLPTYPRELFVDRGNFFVNGSLTLPNAPVITFKYSNQIRTGKKDSTIWGDSNQTGLTAIQGRKFLPNYIQLGERNETWEISLRQTVGNTTLIGTVGGDRINNLDSRSVDRNVGEMKAYGTLSQTPATIPSALLSNQTRGFDIEGFKESATFFAAKLETVVNDKLTVFAGFNYRHATETISGSRLITLTVPTATGVQYLVGGFTKGGRPPYSYTSTGNLKQDVLTGNAGVDLKPMPSLAVQVAVRGEDYKDSGHTDATYVNNYYVQSTGVVTPWAPVNTYSNLKNHEKPWTPAVDARFTGLPNVALYGEWEYRSTKQTERNDSGGISVNTGAGTVGPSLEAFVSDIKEKHQNFKAGVNWTPVSFASLRAEVFTKDHENTFRSFSYTSGDGLYALDYNIVGLKTSLVLKPTPMISLTSRYIVQTGKTKTTGDYFASFNAGDSKRHQISETVDWNPNQSFYLQVNASLVFDNINTTYGRFTSAIDLVNQNSKNDYWNGSAIAGFPIDKSTDAQIQATYYRANNYNPNMAYNTMPFGASQTDNTVTVGLKHQFGPKTLATAKVGYFNSNNATFGGNKDYHGPMAYVAVEHAF